ncbi:MAG: transcriptional regulator [Eisenbergiella porci]|uniref:transcriptional regulator n=1 Tax=Eisenbergiella porci TaxID=2652274 RepID=UPI002A76105A|nr:transcriptional regulator [Eisenbergiella porci]MDY2651036.1 transcriptional regulator [Eisenbergiella porci]
MVYMDDDHVMIDGVILPGLYKSIEVTTSAKVDEQEVEGSSVKPKQATGYEDATINIELELYDSPNASKEEKLITIQNLFRIKGQELPDVHQIISAHTSIRNVDQVIFKNLVSKEANNKEVLKVTLEFMEYIPQTIKARKKGSKSAGTASTGGSVNLNDNYTNYLQNNRGSAPKIADKTAASPAVDEE